MDLPEESLINSLKVNVLHSISGSEGQICYQLIGFLKHIDLSDLARRWMVLKHEEVCQVWKRLSVMLVFSVNFFLKHFKSVWIMLLLAAILKIHINYILRRRIIA